MLTKIANVVITVLMIPLLLLYYRGCSWARPKAEIDVIYISHSVFVTSPEYKIDLKHKKFWKYASSASDYVPRDPTAENEGFVFVRSLDDGKIERFRKQAARYGLAYWKNTYKTLLDSFMFDGHVWEMQLYFSDGTQKKIYGHEAYPLIWNDMNDAFERLTGEAVLDW